MHWNPFTYNEEKFHEDCKEIDQYDSGIGKAMDEFERDYIHPALNAPVGDHEALANLIRRIFGD